MKVIDNAGRTFDVFHVGFEDPPEWMLGLHAIKRLQMDFANEFCTSVELFDEDLEEYKAKYGDYVLADDECNLRVCSEENLLGQYKEVV